MKELQSLCLDVKLLSEDNKEIELKESVDEDEQPQGLGAFEIGGDEIEEDKEDDKEKFYEDLMNATQEDDQGEIDDIDE